MMKKAVAIILSAVLAFSAVSAFAAEKEAESGLKAATQKVLDKVEEINKDGILKNISDIKVLAKELLGKDIENAREILIGEIEKIKQALGDNSIDTIVGDKLIDYSLYDGVLPFIENGTTLIPVRAVTEYLGADVSWDESTQTVTVKKDDTTIELTIDKPVLKVNGEEQELLLAPRIVSGRTMVPIRAVAQALNLKVGWNDGAKTITVDPAEDK